MTPLKDQLADDAVSVFLNSNEFAEAITYTPKGGAGVSIKAIVDRPQAAPAGENSGRLLKNQVKISIANHAVYGVSAIVVGADVVSLPERIGGANVDFIVSEILGQDQGMWQLLLEK